MGKKQQLSVVEDDDKGLDAALGLDQDEDTGFEVLPIEALRAYLMPSGLWQDVTQRYANQRELAIVKRLNSKLTSDTARQAELRSEAQTIEEKTLPGLRREIRQMVARIAELLASEKTLCQSVDVWQNQLPLNMRVMLAEVLQVKHHIDLSEVLARGRELEAAEAKS